MSVWVDLDLVCYHFQDAEEEKVTGKGIYLYLFNIHFFDIITVQSL